MKIATPILGATCILCLSVSFVGETRAQSSDDTLASYLRAAEWASLSPGTAGYQLRILSKEQKDHVEQSIANYKNAVASNREQLQKIARAYSALPPDTRRGAIYKIERVGSGYLAMKAGRTNTILPIRSIGIVVSGLDSVNRPGRESVRATANASQPRPPGTEGLLGALLDGSGEGTIVGGLYRSDGSMLGGLLGDASSLKAKDAQPRDAGDAAVRMIYLKYAKVTDVGKLLNDVFADQAGTKIVPEPRLNALILQAPTELMREITDLVEKLDQSSR